MTSKNLLFTGALLFLLLVTSCVVYFLERFNPFIHKVAYTEYETLSPEANLSQTVFTEKIAIDTIKTVENDLSDSNTTSSQTPPVQAMRENSQNTTTGMSVVNNERNTTEKHKNVKLATKIDTTRIPETVTAAVVTKVKKPAMKKKVRHVVRKKSTNRQTKEKIVIEPVLLSKELHVSPSGKLYRWDRTFLRDIAQKIKQNKKRYIALSVTDKDATIRTYVRNIRAYLLKMGLHKEQIKIKFKNRKQTNKYVFSDQKRDTIEFSLVERI